MLQRSSITSSQADLDAYYEDLTAIDMAPLWTRPDTALEPRSRLVPYVWRWHDMRPQALRALELVGTKEAERRVICCVNPGTGRGATNTLVANVQVVGPGEIARAHRHTPAALRLIIESSGGYTVVNGETIPMLPGDLVLTPNWSWHDHANDTDAPMIWLDGLDTPLVRMLEAGFWEEYGADTQPIGNGAGASIARWRYPFAQARATLEQLAAEHAGSPFDGVIMEYTNPVTGGPTMRTIACYVQMLRPGDHTRAHRHVCCTNYHVIEGSGHSLVGGRKLDWEDKDVFTVPTWTMHEHVNTGPRPAFLFSFTDAPVMKALDLYREEGKR